jgi:hypothetical protein
MSGAVFFWPGLLNKVREAIPMKLDNFDAGDTSKNAGLKAPAKKLATGPRTEAGKRRSSKNSTRHGLFANSVIEGESRAQFRALVLALGDDLGITGATGELLIEKLAVNLWRQARLYRAEGAEILRSTQLRDRLLREHFHDLNVFKSESLHNDAIEPPQASRSEPNLPTVDHLANLISYDKHLSREFDSIFDQLEHVRRFKKLTSTRKRPKRPS